MAKRDLLLHNFWWKVTSLLLAVIVWVTISGADPMEFRATESMTSFGTTRDFKALPMLVARSATDGRRFRITPGVADVTVSANLTEIKRVIPGDIRVFADLSQLPPGGGPAPVRVHLPPGVHLRNVTPKTAYVEFLDK